MLQNNLQYLGRNTAYDQAGIQSNHNHEFMLDKKFELATREGS